MNHQIANGLQEKNKPTMYELLADRISVILGEEKEPLSIADVLRALEIKTRPHDYVIGTDGNFKELVKHVGDAVYNGTDISFNLALPLSAPENSEACEALINLLK